VIIGVDAEIDNMRLKNGKNLAEERINRKISNKKGM